MEALPTPETVRCYDRWNSINVGLGSCKVGEEGRKGRGRPGATSSTKAKKPSTGDAAV